MNTRIPIAASALALVLTLAACGDSADGVNSPVTPPPTTAPPFEDPPDADPTVEPGEEFPSEQAREDAHAVLGMYERDLPTEVRIGRRGEEYFALTEDYMLGRITVELDDDGDGFRVVTATVELPDGPETLELTPS